MTTPRIQGPAAPGKENAPPKPAAAPTSASAPVTSSIATPARVFRMLTIIQFNVIISKSINDVVSVILKHE